MRAECWLRDSRLLSRRTGSFSNGCLREVQANQHPAPQLFIALQIWKDNTPGYSLGLVAVASKLVHSDRFLMMLDEAFPRQKTAKDDSESVIAQKNEDEDVPAQSEMTV